MAVRLRDVARNITVVVPQLGRLVTVDPPTVLRLSSTGLSVELIAVMTGLSEDVVWNCLEAPDPRLGPNTALQHTEQTQALMRRWQRNTITLAALINALPDCQRPGHAAVVTGSNGQSASRPASSIGMTGNALSVKSAQHYRMMRPASAPPPPFHIYSATCVDHRIRVR